MSPDDNPDKATVGTPVTLADAITLLGHTRLTGIMHKPVDADSVDNYFVEPRMVAAVAGGLTAGDVWYGINEVSEHPGPRRRATIATVNRWCALWADLDLQGSHTKDVGGLADYETIRNVIDDLSDTYGQRPTYVVASGNGLQPIWLIDAGDPEAQLNTGNHRSAAVALLKRHQRLVQATCGAYGGDADSVYDLARVLRAPGTHNHKTDPPAETAAWRDSGEPLTVPQIRAALDEVGVTEMPGDDATVYGEVRSAPATWQPRMDDSCGYAQKMIDGWASDTPFNGRHPWLVAQATRIAAARRYGCLTAADARSVQNALEGRFRSICAAGGDGARRVADAEIRGALEWGEQLVARMTDAHVANELGGHTHQRVDGGEDLGDLRNIIDAAYLPAGYQGTAGDDTDATEDRGDPTPPRPDDTADDTAEPPTVRETGNVALVEDVDVTTADGYLARLTALEDGFWDSRPALRTIYNAAVSGTASPWAVLVCVMMRVLAAVPHTVRLPGLGAGAPQGSLNLFAGIVAKSGIGKGVAAGIAANLYDHVSVFNSGAGSGEGVAHLFGNMKLNSETNLTEFHWVNRNVLLDIPEVDMLTAMSRRDSSTIDSVLRQGFSGEAIVFSYANVEKRIRIPSHGYRLCSIIAVQPMRASGLFSGADGGTPQRFIWAAAADPRAGERVDYAGETLSIFKPEWWKGTDTEPHVIDVAQVALDEIHAARVQRVRDVSFVDDPNDATALDGHAMYVREKVAAALAILDTRDHVTADDWRLAGIVMEVSFFVRGLLMEAMEVGRLQAAEQRGAERGAENVGAKETANAIDAARIVDTRRRVVTVLTETPDRSAMLRDLQKRVSKTQRVYLGAALDGLVEDGLLAREDLETTGRGGRPGVRFRIAD